MLGAYCHIITIFTVTVLFLYLITEYLSVICFIVLSEIYVIVYVSKRIIVSCKPIWNYVCCKYCLEIILNEI